jgi:alkylation response protein AidB-like acyl-CoA dehydrogenase
MLADMAMRNEAARTLIYRACSSSSDDPEGELTMIGAMAKCFASDTAMAVTTDAVQLLGGYGYTKDFPVERFMRDAKITQIYEGTNQIQRVVIAKKLLGWLRCSSKRRPLESRTFSTLAFSKAAASSSTTNCFTRNG